MKTPRDIEAAVLEAVAQVLPRGAAKARLPLDADLRTDLGIDSLGLISLMDLVEQALGIDLSPVTGRFAEVRQLGELVGLCRELCLSQLSSVP